MLYTLLLGIQSINRSVSVHLPVGRFDLKIIFANNFAVVASCIHKCLLRRCMFSIAGRIGEYNRGLNVCKSKKKKECAKERPQEL